MVLNYIKEVRAGKLKKNSLFAIIFLFDISKVTTISRSICIGSRLRLILKTWNSTRTVFDNY